MHGADVLALQRAAGNRVVTALLQRRRRVTLARTVVGDVLAQSIDAAWAHDLSDEELAQQLDVVRAVASDAADPALQQTAQENLAVLEQEAASRDSQTESPAAARDALPAPAPEPATAEPDASREALIGPPLALAFQARVSVPAPVAVPAPPPATPAPPPRVPPSVAAGALGAAIVAGLVVWLWPNSTAPPWADMLNPLTGRPYGSQDEYDRVRGMNEEQLTEAIIKRRKGESPAPATVAPQGDPWGERDAEPTPAPAAEGRSGGETCDSLYPGVDECSDLSSRRFYSSKDVWADVRRYKGLEKAVPGNSVTPEDNDSSAPTNHIGIYPSKADRKANKNYSGTVFEQTCCEMVDGVPTLRQVWTHNLPRR